MSLRAEEAMATTEEAVVFRSLEAGAGLQEAADKLYKVQQESAMEDPPRRTHGKEENKTFIGEIDVDTIQESSAL